MLYTLHDLIGNLFFCFSGYIILRNYSIYIQKVKLSCIAEVDAERLGTGRSHIDYNASNIEQNYGHCIFFLDALQWYAKMGN